jgi:hypothetical protein
MFGRIDLVKFQTGLAEAINFVVYPHGPAANRTGTEYVLEVKDSTQKTLLIPFVYSTTQSAVLELGNQYLRIHTNAGTVLEAAIPITSATNANPGVFLHAAHGYNTGDWLFFSSVTGMSGLNGRTMKAVRIDADHYSLTDLAGVAFDTTLLGVLTAGNSARVYEIITPYLTADLFDLHFTQSADVVTIVHPGYRQEELRRLGATNWTLTPLSFTPTQVAPTAPTLTPNPASGTDRTRYRITSIAQDGLEESLPSTSAVVSSTAITGVTNANPGVVLAVAHGRAVGDAVYVSGVLGMTQLAGEYLINTVVDANHVTLKQLDGTVVDTTTYGAYTSGGTLAFIEAVNTLSVAGNKNNIGWTAAAGATRYNVYKFLNGLYGYIGQASGNAFVDNNITPDTTKTPPEPDDPFTSADNWPSEVSYFQGRRWFANTNQKKQNVWATRSGTESNMTFSIPSRDSDRLAFRIAAKQANSIRHLVPLTEMMMLTSGGEWHLSQAQASVLTPASIDPKQDGSIGASNVRPVAMNNAILYAQDRGGHVREIQAGEYDGSRYKTNDLSIMAPHLFDGYTITQMAFARAPQPIVWMVRSDGVLIGLTYVPEHQVSAWHTHTTDGTYESCVVVPEGSEDVLYVIVKRTVNGRTVRYCERLRTRLFGTLPYAFFVDAGVTYNGAPVSNVSGLWHLEGKTVSILADGAVTPQQVVTNGTLPVALPAAASVINIGLPITAQFMTLPLAIEGAPALGQGTEKNVSAVYIRVSQSSSIFVGPSYAKVREVKQRTNEPYGSPPSLISDEKRLLPTGSWNASGQVAIQQTNPLPITVLSMTMDVALGG